jgi:hypothetical protein
MRCNAHVSIFSGRSDPSWKIDDQLLRRVNDIWNQLEPTNHRTPTAPKLGYRGVTLVCESGSKFFAFGGYVTKLSNNITETRQDNARLFELQLLASAPENAIPDGIINIKT